MLMWHALFPPFYCLLQPCTGCLSCLWHGLIFQLAIWHATRPHNPPYWQVGIQQDWGVSTQITDAVNLVCVKSTLPLNTLNQSSAVVCQTAPRTCHHCPFIQPICCYTIHVSCMLLHFGALNLHCWLQGDVTFAMYLCPMYYYY